MDAALDREARQRLRSLVDIATRAKLRGERIGVCRGCGCPWSERTYNCPTCQTRHYARRFYGKNGHVGVPPSCVGCGCDWAETTPGCRPRFRRRLRERHRVGQDL